MYITDQQVQQYQEQGFVLLPAYFSQDEIALMRAALPALFADDSPRRVLEKDGQTVRSVYGSHQTSALFERLTHMPRLVEPARRLLSSEVYVHQFKINVKAALVGDVWEWHQDYIFWRKEDGMPEPRAINMLICLDELNEFNGPLLFVPGSHTQGMIETTARGEQPQQYLEQPDWISNLTADLKYSLDRETLARLVRRHGIVAPKGPSGSVLLFHSNVFHASAPNLSPFDRGVVIVTYNSVENIPIPVEQPRPDFLVGRDYRPIQPLAQDALAESQQVGA